MPGWPAYREQYPRVGKVRVDLNEGRGRDRHMFKSLLEEDNRGGSVIIPRRESALEIVIDRHASTDLNV